MYLNRLSRAEGTSYKERRPKGRDHYYPDERRAKLRYDDRMIVEVRPAKAQIYRVCNDDDHVDELRRVGSPFEHGIQGIFKQVDRDRVLDALRPQIESMRLGSVRHVLSSRIGDWTVEQVARSLAAAHNGKDWVTVSRDGWDGLSISVGIMSNYARAFSEIFRKIEVARDVLPFSAKLMCERPSAREEIAFQEIWRRFGS